MDKKIILASRSKARRSLLKQIGLEFTVSVPEVRERSDLRSGCAALVKKNALLKAEAAAGKFKSGIVIGADTVVLAGKQIIGKPKDKKDAVRTLKLLSQASQWVYTGLAIIDIESGKTVSAFEKTKIYMMPLKDKQIKKYVEKFSPLDKAGSFDIQGPGGIFIDRIEGCYFNVVGLPLALLARLLSGLGVDIF